MDITQNDWILLCNDWFEFVPPLRSLCIPCHTVFIEKCTVTEGTGRITLPIQVNRLRHCDCFLKLFILNPYVSLAQFQYGETPIVKQNLFRLKYLITSSRNIAARACLPRKQGGEGRVDQVASWLEGERSVAIKVCQWRTQCCRHVKNVSFWPAENVANQRYCYKWVYQASKYCCRSKFLQYYPAKILLQCWV